MDKRLLILTAVLFATISTVNALKIDSITFDEGIYAPEDFIVAKVKLSNPNDYNRLAFIRVVNDEKIIYGDALAFVVKPQSSVERTVYFKAPVYKESKNIALEFRAYSDSETILDEETKTTTILVPNYLFDTAVVPVRDTVFPKEEAMFELDISNLGNLENIYAISVEGWGRENVAIENTKVILSPDNSASIKIAFQTPERFSPGEYNIKITTCPAKGECKVNSIVIDVLESSNSLVRGGEINNVTFASGEQKDYQVYIYNDGNVKRDYQFVFDNQTAGIVNLAPSSFSLNPGEGVTVNVKVDASGLNEGDYNLQLKLVNEDEEINKEVIFTVTGAVSGAYLDPAAIWFSAVLVSGLGGYVFWRYNIYSKKKKYEYWK